MEAYTTDMGTLQIMEALTRAGQEVLFGFLRRCETQRPTSPSERVALQSIHFTRSDVQDMKLERHAGDAGRRIRAVTHFRNGCEWRRGRMRIPNAGLPETVAEASRDRPLEDLLSGSPITGLIMKNCSTLKNGTLSVACAVDHGDVSYRMPPHLRPKRHGGVDRRSVEPGGMMEKSDGQAAAEAHSALDRGGRDQRPRGV